MPHFKIFCLKCFYLTAACLLQYFLWKNQPHPPTPLLLLFLLPKSITSLLFGYRPTEQVKENFCKACNRYCLTYTSAKAGTYLLSRQAFFAQPIQSARLTKKSKVVLYACLLPFTSSLDFISYRFYQKERLSNNVVNFSYVLDMAMQQTPESLSLRKLRLIFPTFQRTLNNYALIERSPWLNC